VEAPLQVRDGYVWYMSVKELHTVSIVGGRDRALLIYTIKFAKTSLTMVELVAIHLMHDGLSLVFLGCKADFVLQVTSQYVALQYVRPSIVNAMKNGAAINPSLEVRTSRFILAKIKDGGSGYLPACNTP